MRIDNATFRAVDIRWNSIQLPLRAGTPVSIGGVVANDGNAIGIICQTIRVASPLTQIPVLVGGDVLLDEVEKSYGETLTEEAVAAMTGIRFYDIFGRVVGEAGGAGLPEVTAADNGKVLGVANGAWGKVDAPSAPQIELEITLSEWNSASTSDLDVLSKIAFSVNDLAAVAAGNGKCIIRYDNTIGAHNSLRVADVMDDRSGTGEIMVLFAGDSLFSDSPSEIDGSVGRVYLFVRYFDGAFDKALLRRIQME